MMAADTSLKVKKKKVGRPEGAWVTARRIVQYTTLAVFLVLFLGTRKDGWSASLVNLPLRLDPLLILAHLLASRTFLAGSAAALITIVLTLIFGRAWCGWICPLGTVLDLFPFKRARGKSPPPSDNWRKVKYSLLIALLVAALLGNLTLLFLDPLALFLRTLSASIWPVLDRIVTAAETLLYHIPVLSGPVSSFDGLIRPLLLPTQPLYYRDTIFFTAVFLGVIGLNLFAPRFWCRYLCPLGAMLGLLSKVSIFRRRVDEECKGCTLCTNVCPTGTIDPNNGYRSDPGECTMCMDCVETCPRGLNSFKPMLSTDRWNAYDPGRRDALISIGAAITGVAIFKSDLLAKRQSPYLLRPPGARENNPDAVALTKCTRCGECVRVCPTGAIQPAALEAGMEGMGTPLLVMRLGYCEYSCNACGQVCPVQAIPPLSMETKREQVIGLAYIDQNRCIPWSNGQDCLVCEEMCPVLEKAVRFEEKEVWNAEGSAVTVKLPHVLRDICIGCGICEYKCPLGGEAAIRVFVPHLPVPF
jgi:polyferredoxin